MAIRTERIFVDTRNKAVVANFAGNTPTRLTPFFEGDTLRMELFFGEPDGNGAYRPTTPSWDALRAGLFPKTDAPPAEGSWTATWGANTATDLAATISAAALQTALNALASIDAAGGVTVTGGAGSYKVRWNLAGVRALLVANGEELLPSGFCQVKRATVGRAAAGDDAGTREVQAITLECNPAASCSDWEALPAATATVETLTQGSAGGAEVQRIAIDREPVGGLFKLKLGGASTAALAYNARSTEIQAALEAIPAIGAGNVMVSGSLAAGITVVFQGTLAATNVAELEVQTSGIVVLPGVFGIFPLTDYAIDTLLGGKETEEAVFEIEVADSDGGRDTLLSEEALVINGRNEPETQTTQGTDPILTVPLGDARYALLAEFERAVLPDHRTIAVADSEVVELVAVAAKLTRIDVEIPEDASVFLLVPEAGARDGDEISIYFALSAESDGHTLNVVNAAETVLAMTTTVGAGGVYAVHLEFVDGGWVKRGSQIFE